MRDPKNPASPMSHGQSAVIEFPQKGATRRDITTVEAPKDEKAERARVAALTGGCTAKQDHFARLIGQEQMLKTPAYKVAYDAKGMTDKTCWEKACRLSGQGKVGARIEYYVTQRLEQEQVIALGERARILERLWVEAEHADAPGARVRALELLGKVKGIDLFTGTPEVVDTRTAAELEAELVERLSKLFPSITN